MCGKGLEDRRGGIERGRERGGRQGNKTTSSSRAARESFEEGAESAISVSEEEMGFVLCELELKI